MTFCVFLFVDNSWGKSLFWCLALEYLFFNCSGWDKAIYKTYGTGQECRINKGDDWHSHSFFCPSRQTRARACWSAAGFQSTDFVGLVLENKCNTYLDQIKLDGSHQSSWCRSLLLYCWAGRRILVYLDHWTGPPAFAACSQSSCRQAENSRNCWGISIWICDSQSTYPFALQSFSNKSKVCV